MSVELSLPLKSVEQPLRHSIQELRRGYQSVTECLEQSLAESEARGAELADCRRQLAEARRSLTECERQLAERTRAEAELNGRFAALKKHLESKQAEWTQASERIQTLQTEAVQLQERLEAQRSQCQELRRQVEQLDAERQSWHGELAEMRGQLAPLTGAAAEVARLTALLTSAQAENERLSAELATARDNPAVAAELEQARGQIALLENQQSAWRDELAELREQIVPLAARAAETAHVSGQLQAAQAELERLHSGSASAIADSVAAETAKYRQQVAALEAERHDWLAELSQLRSQVAPLAATVTEIGQLREQLATAQAEAEHWRQQATAPGPQAALEAQLDDYRAQAAKFDKERAGWRSEIQALQASLSQLAASTADGAALAAQLAAAETELVQLRAQLAAASSDSAVTAELERHRAEKSRYDAERTAWLEQLRQLTEQLTALRASADTAEQLTTQLTAAQAEIGRLREELAAKTDVNTAHAAADYQRLCQAVESQREGWEQELASVKAELARLRETPTADDQPLSGIQHALAALQEQLTSSGAAGPLAAEAADQQRRQWEDFNAERQALRSELAAVAEQLAQLASNQTTRGATGIDAQQLQSVLAELREQWTTELPAVAPAQLPETYQQELAAIEAERAGWREELANMRAQFEPLMAAVSEAASLKQRLAGADNELQQLRQRASAAPDIEQTLAAEQSQREQLEAELDALRLRAAELSEALAEQKRQSTAERDQWSEELRQLRKALERQSEFLAQRLSQATAGTPTATTPEGSGRSGGKSTDAVVGSVLEQFEQLQKSKVRKLSGSS